ncbi:hypothetical protein TPHA_0F02350 [Tetrapisispora phaffii CBS 4417]|uniref:NAD-specific glutamate dehydrogenase n=1 Tax=Tetrapisispora phaffii (strain ATCC 24235 / CBS 4417 / NBRC 1672 / NRRL Y-8282 / UCD 70-5) TaxID=1071381 RepID=G8BUD0_TETPH|nr:hypothetical protein TPHA_0F02350 [Tetrapisispora phaffii CBS 4417]CCE63716.1 hypothetical protein TPHA_0F02350 [Tetrapisispora phaffii CBS 4417]
MFLVSDVNNSKIPDISALSISSISDYHVFDFPGKDLQREQVIDLIDQQGFIPDDLIEQEVDWFYNSLGIDDLFFARETPELLSSIIHSLYASKLDSFTKLSCKTSDGSNLTRPNKSIRDLFKIKNKILTKDNHAIFMETSNLQITRSNERLIGNLENKASSLDSTIENAYNKNTLGSFGSNSLNIIGDETENVPYHLDGQIDELYLDNNSSLGTRSVSFWTPQSGLKLTFVYNCNFDGTTEKNITSEQLLNGDIDSISDKTMTQVSSLETKNYTVILIKLVKEREGPVIKTVNSSENNDEIRLLIAFKRFTTKNYYEAISTLFHYYRLSPSKFYLETFKLSNDVNNNSDNIVIFSIYLNRSQQLEDLSLGNNIELSLKQIEREASLLYAIPNNSFDKLYEQRLFSPQEAVYAHVSANFINHFINRLGSDYQSLIAELNVKESNIILLELVENLKRKLRTETFTLQMIISSLEKYYMIVSKLYKTFAEVHYRRDEQSLKETLSFQRLERLEPFKNDQEFESYLNKFIPNDSPALLILKTLNIFNKSILKTNFFVTRKVALSFRLDPKLIMPVSEYSETPYGIFYVIGNTFKGFHIRFREISRGGIRIVTSKNADIYESNTRNVIDENYQLALTQQCKNKDIPEGGSKGVILLSPGLTSSDQTFNAFSQYVDAIIDILIKDPLKETYVDLLGYEEILFFGPDEGTAGYVDWATQHARLRGCPWWKSFLTGKSASLGGIPHDEYGMTSLGVRAYVNALYRTLNLENTTIRKFQTGGPDGDLGSNEILLSTNNELYVAIVDGSGVLCDSNGLDSLELIKLANSRSTVSNYDMKKLSNMGFFVSVDDMDIMIPNSTIVANGTTFRNTFHTQIFKFVDKIDLFVPCGGRPNSINLNNLHYFIDDKTNKSRIPYIIEGANLFINKAAEIALDAHGCLLFKDMSVNKGGVTSSSLEVLASLSLNEEDFSQQFIGNSDEKSPLYKGYICEVQSRIQDSAEKEFKLLWDLKRKTNKPTAKLSDLISQTINKLNDDLIDSNELWMNDIKLRDYLLFKKIIPSLLTEVAGEADILKNIPVPYLKALLSSYLSSSFVYKFGVEVDIGNFLEYIGMLKREALESN